MTISLDSISAAIAARYAASQLTAPAGLPTIRLATSNLPNAIAATPCVLVFPADGTFKSGNGVRQGHQDWLVRFYLEKAADLPRQMNSLRKWLDVLIYQHLTSIQLGGLVAVCRLDGYSVGDMEYGGQTYAGIELSVSTTTSEGWSASV